MFDIIAEPNKKLIRAKLSGLLTVDDVSEFFRQQQAAVRTLGCRAGDFVVLLDTTDMVIQTQIVVAAFQEALATNAHKARKIAIVRPHALARMQARRITEQRQGVAIFDCQDAAEAWLLTSSADAAFNAHDSVAMHAAAERPQPPPGTALPRSFPPR